MSRRHTLAKLYRPRDTAASMVMTWVLAVIVIAIACGGMWSCAMIVAPVIK